MNIRHVICTCILIFLSSYHLSAQCDPIPPEPEVECYETIVELDTITCEWIVEGEMPPEPEVECYETLVFDPVSCQWNVGGYLPEEPSVECWETTSFDNVACEWVVEGVMPPEPVVACFETPYFDEIFCDWVITGEMAPEPEVECWETVTFVDDLITCDYVIEGEMPQEPELECYETATFDELQCKWKVSGEMPPPPGIECYETATFNHSICQWIVQGNIPVMPVSNCWNYYFEESICDWYPEGLTLGNCESDLSLNEADCSHDFNLSTIPAEPTLTCFQAANFNYNTCEWEVYEELGDAPETLCNQTAVYDYDNCQWTLVEDLSPYPANYIPCIYEYNYECCSWSQIGNIPSTTSIECWETIIELDSINCVWIVEGEQPENPQPDCFIFNDEECRWEPEGIPNLDDIENCNQTITILENCEWEITGEGMCNYVTGTISIDLDENGCNKADESLAYLEIQNAAYSTFTNSDGQYTLYTELDSMVINLDTTQFNLEFPQDTIIYFDDSNVQQLDFCLLPSPVADACLILCPMGGIPNGYFLLVRNQGNETISGQVTLEAEHTILQSTVPPVSSVVDSLFTWIFEDLEPYSEMWIEFVVEFEETATIGETVQMIGTVTIDQEDINPQNNTITKYKTVTGFTDPNPNTTALIEGSPIPTTSIGEYVNFVVLFENELGRSSDNTSTVVLRDTLSTDFFDVTTFEPVLYSHNCTVDLCGPEMMVEFDDNIGTGESGFFAYKVRLSDDLVEGDTISTQASIYIDFNPPILADPAVAVIGNAVLSSTEDSVEGDEVQFTISPNPTSDMFTISLEEYDLQSSQISILNNQGKLMTEFTSSENQIAVDCSQYPSGVYIVRVQVVDKVVSRKLVVW